MGFKNELSGSERGWLRKTVAAGVLAAFMLPGSALATASYDAGAFFQFTNIIAPDEVLLSFAVDDDTTTTSLVGSGSASAVANPPFNDDTDLAGMTPNDVRVVGSADPTVGGSVSTASAASSVSITALNLAPTGGTVDVVFEFIYGADALTSLDNALLEVAGASVSILMDTVFGGSGNPIVDESIDLVSPDSDALFNQGLFTLSLAPGGFDGVFVDLFAEGLAISNAEDVQVPVPATLALLGLGLIGFASRRRIVSG